VPTRSEEETDRTRERAKEISESRSGKNTGRNLQQAQLRVEDWERIRNRILRLGQDEAEEALEEQRERLDPEGRNQVYKLEGEATPKTTEALRKGADAARGRSRSHRGRNERN